MPTEFPVVGYGITNAFGDLSFNDPVAIASAPNETNRIFIADRSGQIWVITNLTRPTKTEFLTATQDLVSGGEAGLLGLAFHPGYASNGYFYIYRTVHTTIDGSHYGLHDELARYRADPQNQDRALPGSKQRVLIQYDNSEFHNGGAVQFGPDGYLYLSIGDSGPAPGEGTPEPQPIDRHFFGAVLRIDVDKRPGNFPPNPYPGGTDHYAIPSDNPFIGATNHNGKAVNPNQVRTELYAIGLRNPWRMAFDGSDLYCGDVGDGSWEEIDLIRPGGNYGWPFFEALKPNSGPPAGFASIEPIYSYTRGNLLSQGHCIIGGVVYRGQKIPQLHGAYIFGDLMKGRIWALRHDFTNATSVENLTGVPHLAGTTSLTTFGLDPANGDVLAAALDGRVYRLIFVPPATVSPPVTLADTGAFEDLAALTPQPGIIPYEVSVPFWSDNALKQRWFSVPDPAQQIEFAAATNWTFPDGAVWIKHFELEMTNGSAASRRRIETRFLVKNTNGVYGVTYRWGDSRTNAWLVGDGGMEETLTIRDGSNTRTQVWIYPSRNDCLKCHNAAAGFVLGFNTPQMNCNVLSNGTPVNQIQLLSTLGYLSNAVTDPHGLTVLANPTDSALPIQHRLRSYLQANCSPCHHPDGPLGHTWNARIATPMSAANIINGRAYTPQDEYKIIAPGDLEKSIMRYRITSDFARMPPLATTVLDTNAIELLTEYIRGIPVAPWASQDIGTPGREGSCSILEGVHRVSGSGTNIAGAVDAFHYLFQPLRGNGQLIARLVSSEAKAGIMFRSSVASNASHAMIGLGTGAVLQWQRRLTEGAESLSSSYPNFSSAKWWRLVREGHSLRAYTSGTSSNWSLLAEETIDLGSNGVMGLAISSSSNWVTATAAFDQVSSLTVSLSIPAAASPTAVTDAVEMRAEAAAYGAPIQAVEFYDGTNKIGEATAPPYKAVWTNAIAGERVLRAKALAVSGEAVFSEPIIMNRSLPPTRLALGTSDTSSRGNWKVSYGQQGAVLARVATNLPAHIAVTTTGATPKVWARTTPQRRALQRASGRQRTAAAWTSTTNFSVNIDLLDGALHKVSLYFLDWGLRPQRKQLVEIFDSATGVLLASHSLSNFNRGVYLSCLVRGAIQVRVTRLSGKNAVLSGVLIDAANNDAPSVQITSPTQSQYVVLPGEIQVAAAASDLNGIERAEFFANGAKIGEATEPPFSMTWRIPTSGVYSLTARAVDELGELGESNPVIVTADLPTALAELMWTDAVTQGNWLGVYGSDGVAIPGHATNYPPYARVDVGSPSIFIYSPEGGARELQTVDGSSRIFSAWVIRAWINLQFLDGIDHVVTAYFVDPERTRHQRLNLRDAVTQEVLFTAELPSFGDGQYFVWKVRGHLKMELISVFGPNTYLSGLFFDPALAFAPGDLQLLPSAPVINGHLTLNLLRKKSAQAAAYVVELSEDLITWHPADDGAVREIGIVDLGAMEQVSLELLAPAASKERCFVRLRIPGTRASPAETR